MKFFLKYMFLLLVFVPTIAFTQGRKEKKPRKPKQENAQPAANNRAESESKLGAHRKHHLDIQDKATRKRMKRNERNRRRANKGRTLPFWKRWFRKKH
jgi:hypothetical protein